MELLVGNKAPNFTATAVLKNQMIDNFSLEDFLGENVVFFFYPLDFTFVCPTELHAFQDKIEEFKKRNTKVVGCSIDSQYSHAAWLNTPKSAGGIEGVTYPIVSDITKKISKEFGVLNEKIGIAYRGLFVIDSRGVIRHQLINDLPIGRSVDEVLRVLDAIEFHDKYGDVCPANWHYGEKTMSATQEGVENYFSS